MRKIWVVTCGSGEYSGRSEQPAIAFSSEEAAVEHADKCNAEVAAFDRALTEATIRHSRFGMRITPIGEESLRIRFCPTAGSMDGFYVHEINLIEL